LKIVEEVWYQLIFTPKFKVLF